MGRTNVCVGFESLLFSASRGEEVGRGGTWWGRGRCSQPVAVYDPAVSFGSFVLFLYFRIFVSLPP